jgi:hypothetical protein
VTDFFWKKPSHLFFVEDSKGKVLQLQFQGARPPSTFRAGNYVTVRGVAASGQAASINVTSIQVDAVRNCIPSIARTTLPAQPTFRSHPSRMSLPSLLCSAASPPLEVRYLQCLLTTALSLPAGC